MNFYELGPRQDFAAFWPQSHDGEVADRRVPEAYRKFETSIAEYLGDPPRKPAKKGDFHKSAYSFFFSDEAMPLIVEASRGNLESRRTRVADSETQGLYQVWVLNFVDCLDVKRTIASPSSGIFKRKLGVIKRPAFDDQRWDGSGLFVVPQDPSYCLFCTEDFVAKWRELKLKGALFRKHLMDPDSIEC